MKMHERTFLTPTPKANFTPHPLWPQYSYGTKPGGTESRTGRRRIKKGPARASNRNTKDC